MKLKLKHRKPKFRLKKPDTPKLKLKFRKRESTKPKFKKRKWKPKFKRNRNISIVQINPYFTVEAMKQFRKEYRRAKTFEEAADVLRQIATKPLPLIHQTKYAHLIPQPKPKKRFKLLIRKKQYDALDPNRYFVRQPITLGPGRVVHKPKAASYYSEIKKAMKKKVLAMIDAKAEKKKFAETPKQRLPYKLDKKPKLRFKKRRKPLLKLKFKR